MSAEIFIVATEPSGDQLGASLAKALKAEDDDLTISAIGGNSLRGAGFPSQMDINGLAVLGLAEGLRAYPHVLQKVREATALILTENPRAVVLIDSWGFMVRVAQRLKAQGYRGKVIKFVAPQVWAMRPGRAKILARHVDHLLSIWPMDQPYFEAADLPQTFVGHPILDMNYTVLDKSNARTALGFNANDRIIGLFPGSRPAEISRVAPAIFKADRDLQRLTGGHKSLCVVAEPVEKEVRSLLKDTPVTIVGQSDLLTALASLDGAIACSGTITTQLAAAGVPSVVLYRVSPITYWVGRRIFIPDYISMINIAARQPLMPEFLQDEIDTDHPAKALWSILADDSTRQTRSRDLQAQAKAMKGDTKKPASQEAAQAIIRLMSES